ncbi:MAG: amino acid permease [Clostridia bacterium]|nr:amino acid permease [Clostridia bacterium]
MEKSSAKKGLPAFIGVAAVWMGTHFGPGVASGTQLNVYYVKFGIPGIFVTVLAMALLGYALYCSMEFSRLYKTYDYQSWVEKLFGSKWFVILFDISFLITILAALGGSLNAVGVLISNFTGINYWIGVFACIICAMLLCAYGADLVRKASSYMMFVVVGVLLIIIILVVTKGDGDLAGAIANQTTNLPSVGWGGALWSAVIYASFQATVVANIASVADGLEDRKASKKAALTGWIANSVLLIVLCLTLFSFTNVYAITAEALPFYSLLDRLGFSWLTGVYIVIVFIAVLSTVVGFTFAGIARFGKYYRSKEAGAKHSLRDALFAGVVLLVCAAASKFGIVAMVSIGYKIIGYLNLPIIVLPAIILGGRKISKKYLKEKNIDALGVDLN